MSTIKNIENLQKAGLIEKADSLTAIERVTARLTLRVQENEEKIKRIAGGLGGICAVMMF